MNNSPDTKKGLLDGLMRVLHLHQLPQPASRGKNMVPALKTVPSTPGEIQPIPAYVSPSSRNSIASPERISIPTKSSAPVSARAPILTPPISSSRPTARSTTSPPSTGSTPPKAWPVSSPNAQHRPVSTAKGFIITDYDRILDIVRTHTTIKLDEIARLLSLKEELVAQELQTLEDNGLVEVKYPAFGEPLIYYKTPED